MLQYVNAQIAFESVIQTPVVLTLILFCFCAAHLALKLSSVELFTAVVDKGEHAVPEHELI